MERMTDHGLHVEPADAPRWDDLVELFGRAGASNGCWCQYWLLGPDYHRRDRLLNRADLESQTAEPGSGLIAYRQERAVGWARLSQRADLRWLAERYPGHDFSEPGVWALPCLFVARSTRGIGVMTALISAATEWADTHRQTLQAYPVDPAIQGATRNRFTGILESFLSAGFREVGRLTKDRAIVEWRPGREI